MSWPEAMVAAAGPICIAAVFLASVWIINKQEERDRKKREDRERKP